MNHFDRILLVFATVGVLIILFFVIIQSNTLASTSSSTIKVPEDFPTIQEAIDNAIDGDTILVAAGTYPENLSIRKGITLSGGWDNLFETQSVGDSTINGDYKGRVISITCVTSDTLVTVNGFTIKNGNASGLGAPMVSSAIELTTKSKQVMAQDSTSQDEKKSPTEMSDELRAQLSTLVENSRYPGGQRAYQAMLDRLDLRTSQAKKAKLLAETNQDLLNDTDVGNTTVGGSGGGVYSWNCSLKLEHNFIENNIADENSSGYGGGVFVSNTPVYGVFVQHNNIFKNIACSSGEGHGGGMYIIQSPGANVSFNHFKDNTASENGEGRGGGLLIQESPGVLIADDDFLGNAASDFGNGYGGGLYASQSDDLAVDNCVFFENIATNAGEKVLGWGGGLMVSSSSGSIILDNDFERNTANGSWEYGEGVGGGLFLMDIDGGDIRENALRGNLAALRGFGEGGGLGLHQTKNIHIVDNEVDGNWAAMYQASRFGVGGGIALDRAYNTDVHDNTISENTAVVYEKGFPEGGGIAGSGLSGDTRITANTISANVACETGGCQGGGISIEGAEELIVSTNILTDNVASLEEGQGGSGGGIYLNSIPDSKVFGNTFLGNYAGDTVDSDGGALIVTNFESGSGNVSVEANVFRDNQPGASQFSDLGILIFTNNVLVNNKTSTNGGLGIDTVIGGKVVNNTIFDNGLYGITALGSTNMSLINNIVANHTTGLLVEKDATAIVSYTLWDKNNNNYDGDGTITHSNPVYGDPAFVDQANHDYDIKITSAARDTGDPTGVPPAPDHDLDDIPRPQGPAVDIGAYEWKGHWVNLPLTIKNYRPYHGWVVGENLNDGYGVILHTTDGGRNWHRQGKAGEIPDTDLESVAAIDAQNAWVVGGSAENGVILRTRDGGQTWEQQTIPENAQGHGLDGIFALDGETAWVVGSGYVILHTTDGGATWVRQGQGTIPEVAYSCAYASDSRNVWVIGYIQNPYDKFATVLRSWNGGARWIEVPYSLEREPSQGGLIMVHGVDANTVWIVGPEQVSYTKNSGRTWIDQWQPDMADLHINGVFAVDQDHIWLARDQGGIFLSTDGGANFHQQDVPDNIQGDEVLQINAVDREHAWAVTRFFGGAEYKGHILTTFDGGQTWSIQQTPVENNWSWVSFVR